MQEGRGEPSGGNGEKREEVAGKERERERQSHLVCLISGRIIGLAGGKLLYQPPKGESDFLKHVNKLEERDCPDSTTATVLIRHRALSEPAIPEPSTPRCHSWCWLHGTANVRPVFKICRQLTKLYNPDLVKRAQHMGQRVRVRVRWRARVRDASVQRSRNCGWRLVNILYYFCNVFHSKQTIWVITQRSPSCRVCISYINVARCVLPLSTSVLTLCERLLSDSTTYWRARV